MLTISKMGRRSARYYADLAQEQREFDRTQSGEPPGQWTGSGSTALGLRGSVKREDFLAFFSGFSLEGEGLVQNAGSQSRVPGWDCVFAPSKSVSILWAVLDSKTQAVIEAAHHQAVVKALKYLEGHAYSRRGQAGHEIEKVGLVVATFEHGTNRSQEPYLHTHALVLNVGVGIDGQTNAIHSKLLYQHKMAAGALYRAELSAQLEQHLGLELKREKSWFELKGFSREQGRYQALMNLWSSRREEIEAKNPVSAAEAQVVAYQTRKAKEPLPSRSQLFGRWQETGRQYGFGLDQAKWLVRCSIERTLLGRKFQEWRAVREAATKVIRHQSHFARKEFVQAIAEAAQGRGLDSDAALRLTEKYLASRHVVSLGRIDGEERFANKRMYQLEKQLLAQAAKLNRDRSIRVIARYIDAAAVRQELTDEQREALQLITSKGNIKVLTGISGSGKTHVLHAVREVFEKSGYQVFGVAYSQQGAEKLSRQIGGSEKSMTLVQLFSQIDRGYSPLSQKTIVVVDDAQTIGATDMKRLLDEAYRARAKVILSGDLKQPQAYRHSGALGAIAQSVDAIELTEVHRQEQEWAKKVVRDIADGNATAALKVLAEKELLSIRRTREEAIDQLLDSWSKRGIDRPKDNLMIADNPNDVRVLNRLAQCRRKNTGALGAISVQVGREYLHKGERVRFLETSQLYGVTRGDLGTVERIEPLTKLALVRLDDGKHCVVNFHSYKQVQLGYAVTTTESKNLEVRYLYVLTHGSSWDRALVQMTRAKVDTSIYVHSANKDSGGRLRLAEQMRWQENNKFAILAEKRRVQEQEKPR